MARTPLMDQLVLSSMSFSASQVSGWCPNEPIFDEHRLDLSPCFEEAATLLPVLVLVLFGVPQLISLWKLFKSGYAPSRAGVSALRTKLALASVLCAVQLAFAITVALDANPLSYNLKFPAAVLLLGALVLVLALHQVSHSTLRHASTPLLFFYLLLEVHDLVQLRTMLSSSPPSRLPPIGLAAFVLFIFRLALVTAVFSIELMGPAGWDGTTWRDWVPFVQNSEGKIRLPVGDEPVEDTWEQKECPRLTANIFSILTFSWMTPLMQSGYKSYLTEEDLWALPPADTADALGSTFSTNWEGRRRAAKAQGGKPSLFWALATSFGGPFMLAALFKFLQDILSFTQPQLLGRLLQFVGTYSTDNPEPAFKGYVIALAMFACSVVQTALVHCYFARAYETGMRIRTALISVIYKKSLVLSNTERAQRASGDTINLMSVDATRLQDWAAYAQILWSGVFQLTLAFISLYRLLGWTMFVGVGVMLLSMPVTAMIARVSARLQQDQMEIKDQRTRLMSEILNNIRSIKLYAWEGSFAQRLFKIRNDRELVLLRKIGYLDAAGMVLWDGVPVCVSFASFAMYSTFSGKPLTSEIIFPAITLFQMLAFPLTVLPNVFQSYIEAWVSLKRLSSYLDAGELQSEAVSIQAAPKEGFRAGDELVSVTGGEFTWAAAGESTLEGIDLSVKSGELVSVVGRVGSGKSSLLSAVLGEMQKLSGTVTVRGKVAYAAQQPWIMGGTVRSNIIFGHRDEPEWYDMVLEACALKSDIAILPDGDATEVGEKGISLSGGQKARLSLARAVYARADIYLLDDPLSAVDAHVGKHLFDRVIGPSGLLANKARLLCTNAIVFCQEADELVMLRKGVIIERGTYATAVGGETELGKLLSEFGQQGDDTEERGTEDASSSGETAVDEKELARKLEKEEIDPDMQRKADQAMATASEELAPAYQKAQLTRQLKRSTRPKEARNQGSVSWSVYKRYAKSTTYWGACLYLTSVSLEITFQVCTNIWLKTWSQHNAETGDNSHVGYYLGVYAGLAVTSSTFAVIGGFLLYAVCVVRSARSMHDGCYHAVMASPMSFFEVTPIGTILNRFSADVYVIDEVLARVFGDLFACLALIIGTILVIASSAPIFILVIIPLGFMYKKIQNYYLATSRELKRLNSTTKSPIFASFQETLQGVSTIRAYRQTERFIASNDAHVDRHVEAYFPSICCNRWLAIRLEFIGSIVIFAAALLSVVSLVNNRSINAGLVGLMLSYALGSTQYLNWMVRSMTEVETNIVAVERLLEYTALPPEAPQMIEGKSPPADWPSKGEIKYDNVVARYRPNLDPCLKGTTFTIAGGERVGVVGRTGAGKSSLTMVLYRIIEAEAGQVVIDGVDVSKIGLHDLRSRLSIIPQDSQLFAGTVRDNLDPAGNATDQELWKALEQCRLKEHVSGMEGQLSAEVDEGGSNLSQGQRQLVCLARALLRQSKILVLDEATASVDVESDREIQALIREEFKGRTTFTIAHRIGTILDCDKILVVDQGKVAEFASPAELLANRDSLFFSLAQQAGVLKQAGIATGTNTPRSSGTRTPARKD